MHQERIEKISVGKTPLPTSFTTNTIGLSTGETGGVLIYKILFGFLLAA
jgi:hypothetical protein